MSDQQRFEAAKAAMQGMYAADIEDALMYDQVARRAVLGADALLAELARTAPQPDQAAPQGSAPDALLMARLEAAEAVCRRLHHPDWTDRIPGIELVVWINAKAAHMAQGVKP